MSKNNFNLFKLKLKNPTNPSTPVPTEQKTIVNINSCPIQNNKLNFNYNFWKETKNGPNKMPIQFNNLLINNNEINGIKKNIGQHNLNNEFNKVINPPELNNNNHTKEHIQKTEEKIKKVRPIIQNILMNKIDKTKNYPKIKKIKNINKIHIQKENNPENYYSKSNNLLPLVNKGDKRAKRAKSKNNPKHLFHNKSGGNIKINIDCALKKKLDEKSQIKNNNLNNLLDNDNKEENNNDLDNLLINNIYINNDKNNMNNINNVKNNNININNIHNHNENNIVKLRNLPNKRLTKLINYFYKQEQNLNHKKSMEDFILIKSPFLNIKEHNLSLFALFDGHGGKNVAEYLKNNFSDVLTKKIKENEDFHLSEEILKDTISSIDKDIEKLNAKECGSTGTIVIIDNDIIYSVNVGDSKSFYINDKNAIQITEDHNCKNKIEVERVKKRDVKVFNGRVFGCLCLTRTFGDTDFKEVGIDCEPYIQKISINKNNIKYIVIASDGIWDIVDDKQLFKIKNELKSQNSEEFCNNLVEYSLKGGSNDDISCIVLKFGE